MSRNSETPDNVADTATNPDALRLNQLALIGTLTAPRGQMALVRTARGQVVRVSPGDQLGSAVVAAIGDSQIHVVQSGRTRVFAMPKG